MQQTSKIYLSKSALRHNIEFIRNILGPSTRLSSVVKGNAYGHGIEQFVPMVCECGVDHFSVFSIDEAQRVCDAVDEGRQIMIMGMFDNEHLEWIIKNNISFFVFEIDRLKAATLMAKKLGIPARVHIEIETGMNRTGFSSKVLTNVLEYLKKESTHLIIMGFCTHLAGAESISNYHRIKSQYSIYNRAYNRIVKAGVAPQYKHIACSAAAIRYPKSRMDLARIGILQYGFFPSQEILIHYLTRYKLNDYPLKRVISWKSKVMSVKSVKSGEFVGYGTSFLANRPMKIATIPVGYSHGFSRSLSNQGRVLIHEQRVSVVGTINMNMISVDVTNIDNVNKGDEVVFIGKQGELEISVASFSDLSDQLNYELLTRLPSNIPRLIIE